MNKQYVLFRYSKKTGKVDKCLTGFSSAMLSIWALNYTTKTKESIIVEPEALEIIFTASGKANDMPSIDKTRRPLDGNENLTDYVKQVAAEVNV